MTGYQEQEHKCSYPVNITTQVSEVCVTNVSSNFLSYFHNIWIFYLC